MVCFTCSISEKYNLVVVLHYEYTYSPREKSACAIRTNTRQIRHVKTQAANFVNVCDVLLHLSRCTFAVVLILYCEIAFQDGHRIDATPRRDSNKINASFLP